MGAALGYAFLQPANETIPVFISLSAGFSFPYVLLAIFPDLIAKLPKPGQWMKSLEFFAFPMLATAIWLLWVFALQTSVNEALILLIGWLLLGLNFWSFLNLQNKIIKIIIFIISIMGITLPSLSLSDNAVNEMSQNLIPESNQPNQNYTSWYPGIENDLQEKNTVTYFINFTAAWCITCQTNELTAFSKKLLKIILLKITLLT